MQVYNTEDMRRRAGKVNPTWAVEVADPDRPVRPIHAEMLMDLPGPQ